MKNVIALFLFMYCQQVFSHTTSDSYLNINLSEQQSSISWSIAVRDLEFAVGLDVDEDKNITWAEVLQRKQVIEAYVLSRLSLYTVSNQLKQSCHFDNKQLLVDDKSDGAYLVFDIVSPCLNQVLDSKYVLDYQLMFDIDKNHRGLVLINDGKESISLVASPDNHTFSFNNNSATLMLVFTNYVIEGVWHILIGLDHILFLLALLLPAVLVYQNGQWQQRENIQGSFVSILKIVTAFTLAHSITLSLSILKIVQLPSQLVEVVIAVTVLLTCIHTLKPIFQHALWKLAFIFGLIHGFGFANVLLDLGLEKSALALSLFGFNVGVELGQLFIVCAFVLFASVVHRYWWYRIVVFRGGITVTAILSSVWIIERSLNYEILGL